MLNKEEVNEICGIVNKYHIKICDIFGLTRSDSDILEVRDWINNQQYLQPNSAHYVDKREYVLYLFDTYGLHFRLLIKKSYIIIDYTGNEFGSEISTYYFHNNKYGDIKKKLYSWFRITFRENEKVL